MRVRIINTMHTCEDNGRESPLYCYLDKREELLMEKAFQSTQMSARCYYRVLKVARTIADLDGSEKVEGIHIEEALECRMGGEKYWGT